MFGIFGKPQIPKLGQPSTVPRVGADRRPIAQRGELRLVMMGIITLVLVICTVVLGRPGKPLEPLVAPPIKALPAMTAPKLTELSALPNSEEMVASLAEVEQDLKDDKHPSLLTGFGAHALAWAEILNARDREQPILPQRINGEDLAHRSVEPGQAVVLSGRLVDLAAAPVAGRPDGYRWLSLALDSEQFVLVLAPADAPELVLNDEVAALGRYLGNVDVTTATGIQEVPLIMGRSIEPVAAAESSRPAYLAEFQGAVRIPDDLYADINDKKLHLETRPYYFTIGQLKTELDNSDLWINALDANAHANEIHQHPDRFRGRACTVRGKVYHVWKDGEVAADHPFDVRTVTRVLIYKRDSGPITEDGKTTVKGVLRLYELALVGDRPAPKPGEWIEADGRFLRWRAFKVKDHPEMARLNEVKRQSEFNHSMFFVAAQWRPFIIPTIDWRPVKIGVSIFFGLFFVLILIWLKRERGVERRLQAEVMRLRQGRRALALKEGSSSRVVPGKTPVEGEPPAQPPAPAG